MQAMRSDFRLSAVRLYAAKAARAGYRGLVSLLLPTAAIAAPEEGARWRGPLDRAAVSARLVVGPLFVEGRIPGRALRFRDDGDAGYVALSGRDRLLRDGEGYVLTTAEGARWRFGAAVASREQTMIAPQWAALPSVAWASSVSLPGGETRRWLYEERVERRDCGPVGRFGLTNPACREQRWSRIAAVVSNRGVALVPAYASDATGDAFGRMTGATLLDHRACRVRIDSLSDWHACQPGARVVRTVRFPPEA